MPFQSVLDDHTRSFAISFTLPLFCCICTLSYLTKFRPKDTVTNTLFITFSRIVDVLSELRIIYQTISTFIPHKWNSIFVSRKNNLRALGQIQIWQKFQIYVRNQTYATFYETMIKSINKELNIWF